MKSTQIDKMIELFSRLPGLGPRSARRVVLYLIRKKDVLMVPLAKSIFNAAENIENCNKCGNLDENNPCYICSDFQRDSQILCVVEEVSDLWALERGGFFKGRYHVLGGSLDALSGISPEKLKINSLFDRIADGNIKEIILATSSTLSGQTTANYLYKKLKDKDINITRLSRGLPVGGELDYLDDGTLGQAIEERVIISNK